MWRLGICGTRIPLPHDFIACTGVALCYFINKIWDTKLKLMALATKAINKIVVSDIGKNLTEKDVLVLPMDMLAVEEHKVYFQQVIDHFGQVIWSHCILIYIHDIILSH